MSKFAEVKDILISFTNYEPTILSEKCLVLLESIFFNFNSKIDREEV